MSNRLPEKKQLSKGDVLKTHPLEGYWGCALVLSEQDRTSKLEPVCHIGITTLIFTRDYSFGELDLSAFEILHQDVNIRVGPNKYVFLRHETCIGIYSRRITPAAKVIGSFDIDSLSLPRLAFKAGDGTGNGWPFCGKVVASLGCQAVHAWRKEHDKEQWKNEIADTGKSFEKMLLRIKKKERQKRSKKKKRKSTNPN